jgi:type II restriction/modification system DNA methylase subunit YeeA
MNTAALKTFAPAVRRQLMEAVTRKLDFALSAKTPDFLTTYASQVAALRKLEQTDRSGLIERVAYTWFNRLAALRFMDARGWHPFRARVLTAASAAETQPELLKLTRTGALPAELQPHTNPSRLNDLLDGKIPSPDAQGEVYRSLVLAACHFYHALLPDIFEKLDDETELLLPDDLLTEHSIVHGFRTEISDEDCGEVEILGWLYQFYISEKKAQVMARKSAVPTEDIPAVTQLFTPHWIVRYLVENSLGRLWLLNHPGSKLRDHMPYYIEGEENAPGGSPADFLKITKPEEIRLLDPAGGSGHMLTYAFDLLVQIYEEEGYAPNDIPGLILRHNLSGLEICPRAAQLAELALVFKAREKSRRFFQPEYLVRPNIIELREVRFGDGELSAYFKALGVQPSAIHQELNRLLHQFEEAKNFGSLIRPCLTESEIQSARAAIITRQKSLATADLMVGAIHSKVLRVLEQSEALTQRYHVVVTNPPYMGGKQMNARLKVFGTERYPSSRSDAFAMFIERSFSLSFPKAYSALVTMQSWMFLSGFEELRRKVTTTQSILTMAHLGARAFDTIGGDIVQATAFVMQNKPKPERRGVYVRLTEVRGESEKEARFREAMSQSSCGDIFRVPAKAFQRVPGAPIAYWASEKQLTIFENCKPFIKFAEALQGIITGDTEKFLRLWFEVQRREVSLGVNDYKDFNSEEAFWVPYTKGGTLRKWYGNNEYVVNWKNRGSDLVRSRSTNAGYYFKPCLTWTLISSSDFAARYCPSGFLWDVSGSIAFAANDRRTKALLGFLCSALSQRFLKIVNPTINTNIENILCLPLPLQFEAIEVHTPIFNNAIQIARDDWDNFETSWDFRDQPLLRPALKGATLAASWKKWEAHCQAAIRRMQELETENNRLFITAFGLQDELKPEVPEDQITLARADAKKDMAAFLSYAIGCMMGRYSMDQPGLILANAGDTVKEYLAKVKRPLDKLTFTPDEDGIIPVLDGEWFEDDIVARTRDFLRATFGEATLRENLRFIEDSIGKDLRKYFLNDFYKDHLQTYKKRPIYWLVQSPEKGFSVLIYLHRYTRDTMNLVLNRYLRDYQVKLRNRLAHVTELQVTAATAREKTEARRETENLTKILAECDEWERQTMLPLAQARIELDLDDGVKTNYLKLGEALAPITGLAAKEDE